MSTTSPTVADRVPPHVFFVVSAVLHYLGPSFAVLLFAQLAPSGVAWLRIATAGAVFAVWPPWRFLGALPQRDRAIVVSLGVVLAAAVGVGGFVRKSRTASLPRAGSRKPSRARRSITSFSTPAPSTRSKRPGARLRGLMPWIGKRNVGGAQASY